MDVTTVVELLQHEHPGRPIIQLPAANPTEILCELTSAAENPGHGVAIAVVDRSVAHYHRHTRELYTILSGSARVWIDGAAHDIDQGETVSIEAGRVHWVEADAVCLRVDSWPAWTPEDHILVSTDRPR